MKDKQPHRIDYSAFLLGGFVLGQMLYFFVLLAIRSQMNGTRDYDGYSLAWGYRTNDLANWALLIPLVTVGVALAVARLFPPRRPPERSGIQALLILILFMFFAIWFGSGPVASRTFPTPRDLDKIQRDLDSLATPQTRR